MWPPPRPLLSAAVAGSFAQISPAARPLGAVRRDELAARLDRALAAADGETGAPCIHEMPMRYIDWLPRAYEVALGFRGSAKGRSNIYLVLLDYRDRLRCTYGVYVGMSKYSPAERFDQHKAGIRASGSVLKRGLEVLTGPTLHLQRIKR